MRFFVSHVMCLAFVYFTSTVYAEITPREAQRFCVDIALLKGGVELRGAVLSRDEKQLRMAVQRSWLTVRYPELAKQIDEDAAQQHTASRDELIQRIEAWKIERAADTRLVAVLNREMARLAKAVNPAAVPDSQFVVVVTPADRVRRVFTASAASRQVAMVAWSERMERVEESVLTPLEAAVEKKRPDWQTMKIDLSDRLPTGQAQTADEWAARQAIFEYEYREKLDFQGTGHFVIRVGEGAEKPDLKALFARTAADAIQGELGGLGLDLGLDKTAQPKAESNWQTTAIEQAQTLKRKGFRVTRVPKITGSGPATVTVSFFARLGDGKYRMIWSNDSTTDPAAIKQEALDRLQQDPQVQEIQKIASALSLGNDAATAIRFGAAVQASLDGSETRFFEFRQRYNNSLDGPPLVVPVP
jgi:hypothetical protein